MNLSRISEKKSVRSKLSDKLVKNFEDLNEFPIKITVPIAPFETGQLKFSKDYQPKLK